MCCHFVFKEILMCLVCKTAKLKVNSVSVPITISPPVLNSVLPANYGCK